MLVLIIFFIVFLVFLKIRFLNIYLISKEFKKQNVIVFGKKGKGKDVLFAAVIWNRRKKHYSNIKYNDKTEVKQLDYLSVAPNTYHDFIKNDITIIDKNVDEKIDYYLSDGGIYLPSQYDSTLSKTYPSLPIYYALSRHLANANIHVNTQNLNRLWIKLREQADCYIRCRGVVNLGLWVALSVTEYENYDDALKMLKPVKKLVKNTELRIENSSRGKIKNRILLIPKRALKYDSRYFHRVVYGVPAPGK